ncbi:hydrolase 76 protein [Ascosphaera aggregata]|nr:hydrolase 76 protein [Ascosphaera aggregata]
MRLFTSRSSGRRPTWSSLLASILLGPACVSAQIPFDPDDKESVKAAAKTAAKGMVSYYHGNEPGQIPGLVPQPLYWWIGGAMFGSLIDYYYYTGDSTWNNMTIEAMMFQVGDNADYKPLNQSHGLGNDDQAFWAMSAMSAAENKFPDPPKDKPQWLALVQAVFNEQVLDWYKRNDTCGGGLMWQIFEYNPGFNYKNAISNGCFFNIASRLALYTGNDTYAEWADRAYNWTKDIGIITDYYQVLDGASTKNNGNCTQFNTLQWSYNMGVYLLGAATMYAYRGEHPVWKERIEGLIKTLTTIFFNKKKIMAEVACEPVKNCNDDQQTFKAYTSRWMAATIKVAPFTKDLLMPYIRASSIAAAKQCSGPNYACGMQWTEEDKFDGITGLGEQMSAMEVFLANLIPDMPKPANNETGTSKGDPAAGTKPSPNAPKFKPPSEITTADRAGAGILTALVITLIFGAVYGIVVR